MFYTNHGTVATPAFMPVATHGAVKAMTSNEIESIGFDILVVNAYHIYLRPGHSMIKKIGGMHEFMSWKHPILTDSGGFQALSLSKVRKTDDGRFFNHIGWEPFFNTQINRDSRGAKVDIMMCLMNVPYDSNTNISAIQLSLTPLG
jgi:queuine tRNA-ribosyltransferase